MKTKIFTAFMSATTCALVAATPTIANAQVVQKNQKAIQLVTPKRSALQSTQTVSSLKQSKSYILAREGTNSGGGGNESGIIVRTLLIEISQDLIKMNEQHLLQTTSSLNVLDVVHEITRNDDLKIKINMTDRKLLVPDQQTPNMVFVVSAISYPNKRMTEINEQRFNKIVSLNLKKAFILHEVLVLLNIESTGDYSISSPYLELLQKQVGTNSAGVATATETLNSIEFVGHETEKENSVTNKYSCIEPYKQFINELKPRLGNFWNIPDQFHIKEKRKDLQKVLDVILEAEKGEGPLLESIAKKLSLDLRRNVEVSEFASLLREANHNFILCTVPLNTKGVESAFMDPFDRSNYKPKMTDMSDGTSEQYAFYSTKAIYRMLVLHFTGSNKSVGEEDKE